jgi:hypothetical protein
MLGAINGHYINRFAVNSRLVNGLSVGVLDATQASATVVSAGALTNGGALSAGQGGHQLGATAANALTVLPVALLSDDHLLSGLVSVAVASVAQLDQDDQTLLSTGRTVARHRPLGATLARHATSGQLTPHQHGSRLTVH